MVKLPNPQIFGFTLELEMASLQDELKYMRNMIIHEFNLIFDIFYDVGFSMIFYDFRLTMNRLIPT